MKREKLSKAAASGAVALIFLVLGFQAAIFTGNVFRYNREHHVDTVYVVAPGSNTVEEQASLRAAGQTSAFSLQSCSSPNEPGGNGNRHQAVAERASVGQKTGQRGAAGFGAEPQYIRPGVIQKGLAPKQELNYSDSRRALADKFEKKPEPETFEFDPNTVTHADLVRLGFSDRQAQVIENYRAKGGKYNSKRDFAKMYVVDSAAFARLEPYIKIQKLNLNTADSAALIGLRGIGPYYASKILEYRARLGGVFTSKEQLLEIDGIDADRLGGFAQSITVGHKAPRFTLWNATREELSQHPYIGAYAAKGIIRYKSVTDTASWSLDDLVKNGVIAYEKAEKLRYLVGDGQVHHE